MLLDLIVIEIIDIFLLDHYLGNNYQIRKNEVLLLAIVVIFKFIDDFTHFHVHNFNLFTQLHIE